MLLEERQHALPVGVARSLQRLIVLGTLNNPQFLGLAGAGEKILRHFWLDVGVTAAVNHEQGARRQPRQGSLQVRIAAAALAA